MQNVYVLWLWPTMVTIGLIVLCLIARSQQLPKNAKILGGILFGWFTICFSLAFASFQSAFICIFAAISTLYMIVAAGQLLVQQYDWRFTRSTIISSAKAFLYLAGACVFLQVCSNYLGFPAQLGVGAILSALCLAVAVLLLVGGILSLRRYRLERVKPIGQISHLPTVTLAIPARNETHALDQTLSNAIKSSYPKLEILVLDDCSQDKTAEIIKSYAQDGVRFVQGKVPADGWLGKNYACKTLAAEASGDIIIFAGVDTHFSENSIGLLISYMRKYSLEMLSTQPQRRGLDVLPQLLAPLHIIWQALLPITKRRLPVASTCWAITADSLRRLGGFDAVRNNVFPETFFARQLFAKNAYRYLLSDQTLGVTTRKKVQSQVETTTRTMYPFFQRRVPAVLLLTVLASLLLLFPYAVVVWQLGAGQWSATGWVCLTAIVLQLLAHLLAVYFITPRLWPIVTLALPLQIVWELLLINFSMLLFEFSEVNWKGRNVCYPVIEAISPRTFKDEVNKIA